jgi:hypothetical protein
MTVTASQENKLNTKAKKSQTQGQNKCETQGKNKRKLNMDYFCWTHFIRTLNDFPKILSGVIICHYDQLLINHIVQINVLSF